jgi:RND family efflux transporter MFP subunit
VDRHESADGPDHPQRTSNPPKDRRQGIVQLVLILLFIGGAFILYRYLAAFETPPEPEAPDLDPAILVRTQMVAPQTYALRFSATGTVQVRALADLVPQVSGRVVDIDERAFPGGVFTSETILFRIEEDDYRNEVDLALAEVAGARTRLSLQQAASEAAAEEWRELNPDRPVPSLVAQTPQLEEAKAALQAAQAGLRMARLNLARTRYRLPFEGRVMNLQLENGQYVVAGQSYGQVYRLASLEVHVPLPERHLRWLLEAEEPQISVSGDSVTRNRNYPASVKRVSASLDPQTRFALVVLELREAEPDLVPDVFVNVRFVGPERRDVWLLPLEALQIDNLIWVVDADDTLRSIEPRIIQITQTHAIAHSDGRTIRVVHGNLAEATEGTPVQWEDEGGRGEHPKTVSG